MSSQGVVEFVDRKGVLMAMGAVLIVLGLMSLLGAALQLAGPMISTAMNMSGVQAPTAQFGSPWRVALLSASFSLAKAVLLLSVGIGSILARRWARALTMAYFGLYLFIGIFSLLSVPFSIPLTKAMLGGVVPAGETQMVSSMVVLGLGIAFVQIAVFQVALPLLYILVYRSDSVRHTCAYYSPRPSWTDRCPAPLLVLVLAMAMGGLTLTVSALTVAIVPTPWGLLTGPLAALLCLVLSVVMFALAYGFYRRSHLAWWGYLLLMVVYGIAAVPTLRNLDLRAMLEAMSYPPQMLDMLGNVTFEMLTPLLFPMAASVLVVLGYLIYVRRFLRSTADEWPRPAGGDG